ncbi:MAG TPA: 2-hydroxy-3-oxopropionate reductase [Thermodesulfobacteriota bacterium]|nr:2-hydroxy-3-oxopropionate reductase [Thermodesulfobacteriota bacterium]
MLNIGFIGLGIMGRPMAANLIKNGYTLSVYNRSTEPMEALKSLGASPRKNAREAAEKSDVVILMLPDTPDVESVLFGEEGVSSGIKAGAIVIDMSSISPMATRKFAERLLAQGVEMLDAPVSGGQIGAENATLSIMVGGKAEVFDKVKPILEAIGKNIVRIGGNGDGQVCKVANQIVVALTIEAVGEALLLASKAGADVRKVREALLGGFAQSRILEVHGERMIQRTFKPGFKIKLHQKDLNLALQAARELKLSLPNTALAQELFTAVSAQGGAEWDHSALVQALEKLADWSIA